MSQDAPPAAEPNNEYKGGRPFVFTNPVELQTKIQGYFDRMDPHIEKQNVEDGRKTNGDIMLAEREVMTSQKVYTLTGLARHLGVSRDTIRNYRHYKHYSNDIPEENKQELIRTIEDAVQRVEEFNEGQLHKSGISNGVKFNLTNNFGWIDKQVVETATIEEELDNLDDAPDGRASIAEAAAAALADQPGPPQPEQPETPSEPGSTPPQ